MVLCMNGNNRRVSHDAIYFDNFGVKHIPKEIEKLVANKNVIKSIFRIQAFD